MFSEQFFAGVIESSTLIVLLHSNGQHFGVIVIYIYVYTLFLTLLETALGLSLSARCLLY